MIYKFTSNHKDDYSKFIEDMEKERENLADKYTPRLIEVKTNLPDTTFFTKINNYDYKSVNEVRPGVKKDSWKYTVVKK